MRRFRLLSAFNNIALACALILGTGYANAVVNSTQSRLVFNGDSMAETLTVVNSIAAPALVQVWTDDNDPFSPPDHINTPLVIVPPVFKLSQGESRNLRVMLLSRQGLPTDREKVYWLNIYQIPPNTQPENAQGQRVVLPLRIRLKIFVRPVGLKEPKDDIGGSLVFSLKNDTTDRVLSVNNPTPYYMTLGDLSLDGKPLSTTMISPLSSVTFPLAKGENAREISWSVIDDHGKQIAYKRQL